MNMKDAEQGIEQQNDESRLRLLDAGERLFAEHGFDGTSVRQITSEAGCNVAAVNYHFGGKAKLYLDVFRRALRQMTRVRIDRVQEVMAQPSGQVTLELLLDSFAKAFVEPLIGGDGSGVLLKLLSREMSDGSSE